MHPPLIRAFLITLLLSSFSATVCAGGQDPLAQADQLYAEKSFAPALKAYESVLIAGTVPGQRQDEVAYRICVCLGRSKQWDRALLESVSFVRSHRRTVWEPRGLYWLGQLYLGLPEYGWRAGDRTSFNEDVPDGPRGERAMGLSFEKEHPRNARDALEAAAVFYPAYRAQFHTEAEEIQLCYDLASQIVGDWNRWGYGRHGVLPKGWPAVGSPQWRVDILQPYSPAWPVPKKILYLYRRAQSIAPDAHSTALARMAGAYFVDRYQQHMKWSAVRQTKAGTEHLPYPYQELSPLGLYRAILTEFPTDPIVSRVRYEIARWLAWNGQRQESQKAFNELAAGDPADPWVKNAIAQLAAGRRPYVGFDRWTARDRVAFHLPSEQVKLRINTSNTERFHLEVRVIDFDRALTDEKPSDSPFESPVNFHRLLGTLKRAEQYLGKVHYASDFPAGVRKEYRGQSREVILPSLPPGLYLVTASIPGVRSAVTLHISDLKLLAVSGKLFAARAGNGVPASGIPISMVWTYREQVDKKWEMRKLTEWGRTDAKGLMEIKAPPRKNAYEFKLLAVAQSNAGFAYISTSAYGRQRREEEDHIRGYGVTDRPVYRPGQTVNYRFILLNGKGGDLRPVTGRQVRVEIPDATGGSPRHETLKTSSFGTASGSFNLNPAAKPGEYGISGELAPERKYRTGAYARFRVEEYRKPEFEVTVTPDAGRVQLGKPAGVTVAAKYYFGGAVAGASVTYRVFRGPWMRRYHFPQPYDFLRDRRQEEELEDTEYRHGEMVAQGTARTGPKGRVRITFATSPGDEGEYSGYPDSDWIYTVEADVRDVSRRTISGSGTVKATRHDVAVFLDNPRGYVTSGEALNIEIATMDPQNRPVASQGNARILRIPDAEDTKPVPVFARSLATDMHGRANYRWTPKTAGHFQMEYTTRDSSGQSVREALDLWVSGPELTRSRAKYKNVQLFANRAYYEEGQTARILIVTPRSDCTALLLRMTDREVLEWRLVHISGHSQEIQIALTKQDSPNIAVQAILVRNGETFTDSLDIFVPPARQLLDVAVRSDRTRYQPGESAVFRVTARDHRSRPARTELSLAVTDDALRYIQRDYASDIRADFWSIRSIQRYYENNMFDGPGDGKTEDSLPPGPTAPEPPELEGMGLLREWPYSDSSRRGRGSDLTLGGGGAGGGLGGGMGGAPPVMAGEAGPVFMNYAQGSLKGGRALMPGSNTRRRFLDTALWLPSVVTDSAGTATVRVKWPDNLTRWRCQAVGVTESGAVGNAESTAETSKDLLVRLQTPRFLVERDETVVSAVVHNAHAHSVPAQVSLALGGDSGRILTPGSKTVLVPAKGERRVDWTVRAVKPGALRIRAAVQGAAGFDATENAIPIITHGIERVATQSGVIGAESQFTTSIDLTKERRAGSAALVVRVNGSTMTVMLDALPYLLNYPYNCVEQTLSRFVPAAVVLKAVRDSGISPDDPRWKGRGIRLDRLQVLVRQGLEKIVEWQQPDGGWGWWAENPSDPNMTGYVVSGLVVLKSSGLPVDDQVLNRGLTYLQKLLPDEKDLNRKASIARVLVMDPRFAAAARAAADTLFPRREGLVPRALAELATVLAQVGEKENAEVALRNLENTARVDETGGTVHWEASGRGWSWQGSDVETTAAALEAYVALDPGGKIAQMARKWLIGNRRDDAWASTLETSTVLYALAGYARANRETAPDCTVTVSLDSGFRREIRFTPKDELFADEAIRIPDSALRTGSQTLTLTRTGSGTLYCATRTAYFSEEDPIPPVSGDIAVERRYYRLIPGTASGDVVAAKSAEERPNPFLTGRYELLEIGGVSLGMEDTNVGALYRRAELKESDPVSSGDLIEVELRVRSNNNYSYLAFEDHKPAGCEPVEVRSGGRAGTGVWSNMELHDRTVAFFVSNLPQGTRTLLYRLWVEAPGSFHVLPTNGYAMYAPNLRALSGERRLSVRN